MKVQAFIDAVIAQAPDACSIGTKKTAPNSVKVPDVDMWINFDIPSFKLDMPKVTAQSAKNLAQAIDVQTAMAATRQVQEKAQFYIDALAAIGITGIEKADLMLIIFDAASVRDWGFVTPAMQALFDKLAPAPTSKK